MTASLAARPPRFPGDPFRAFASFKDPGRTDVTSPSYGFVDAAPRSLHSEGFSVMEISGLPRGFSTCCLRFTSGVATTHAKLASGWLARLYREGVEPTGPLQKVSDHILVSLFWIYPGARRAFLHLSYSCAPPKLMAALVSHDPKRANVA